MSTEKLEVGTKVKHTITNAIGVVVPDAMGLCGQDHVMVDFDGVNGDQACLVSKLQGSDKIQVIFDRTKCEGCIFANHSGCKRYGEARMGWMMSGEKGKKWSPKRMYPFCQGERGSHTNDGRKE
jgi:hypothetical protein